MLKRKSKTLSVIMALCLCLAMIAPIFVAPPAAMASSTATATTIGNLAQEDYLGTGTTVGVLKVTLSDFDNLTTPTAADPWIATISFPTRLAADYPLLDTQGNGQTTYSATAYDRIFVTYGSKDNAFASGDVILEGAAAGGGLQAAALGTFDVKVVGITDPTEDGSFYLNFVDFDCTNFAGDVNVTLAAGSKVFTTQANIKIANVNGTGKTMTLAKSVRKITSSGGVLDNISIMDVVPGSIEAGGNYTLKMESKGFNFETPNPSVVGYQRFDNNNGTVTSLTDEQITGKLPAKASNSQTKGLVGIVNVSVGVDEKVARVGQDIEVTISGDGITEETIVVGQYVDYLTTVTLDKATELIAGRSGSDKGQVLGTFFIEEVAPGTLVEDRSILLELPVGLEWNEDETSFGSNNYEVVNNSSITLELDSYIDQRTMKLNVLTGSDAADNGAKILFKNLAVDVSPSAGGKDVVLTISGKAGVEGTVNVSKVIPMFTMTAETPKIVLGVKDQKVSDVVITESKANAFIDSYDGYGGDTALKFYLDAGFRFAKVPKVEVVEGDVVLETNDIKITTPRSGQNLLIVPIRAGSYKTASKIKISEIYVTADRTAPTGKIAMYAADTASDFDNVASFFFSDYGNAFNDCFDNGPRFMYDIPCQVDVADNATVPPTENAEKTTGTFKIGSNLYTVNGVTRVMDAAPYIKAGRTYVPYRYLGYVLGVAEANVVWDEAAKTVTMTKGTTVVVATIGSTTLTVNGEAKVMEVAPEIVNGRTMLPARFLAEALGATVGWDEASQTVVIEM